MNDRYNKLLDIQIESFVNLYNTSMEIFENLDNRNKLLHSGEYGVYRENAVKKILQFALPKKFGISTGFLINSHNQTSTQCDLIVYEINETPLIEADEMTRFFPVEAVAAIGEVKSDLTQKQLIDAIIKLSDNKALLKLGNDFQTHNKNFNEQSNINTLYSFLICNDIKDFNHNDFFIALENAYTERQVPNHHRHNIIVSIQRGVLTYEIPDNSFQPTVSMGQKMNAPCQDNVLLKNSLIKEDQLKILKYFLCSISGFIKTKASFYADPVEYIY